ncbi:hypothetical protein IOD16_36995 [Saccharothrix sp. 6-C]|uniref:hypothetical protein n=1 Tax=Saccharothrix sp. 6-C TaxID=2781735 RepID=UPI001917491C|nr:hypothetical protein [Saccharothrix sp. 6-C]QQQ76534.1 hypothetical protein IOD16_36995 [Saccharothrix sp. 6-C]
MNQRIAAALIGATMGLATFAGSTIAVSAAAPKAEQPPQLQQDQVSEVICRVLKELDLLDNPALADLVKNLKCKDSDKPTETTTSTSASETNEPGRR